MIQPIHHTNRSGLALSLCLLLLTGSLASIAAPVIPLVFPLAVAPQQAGGVREYTVVVKPNDDFHAPRSGGRLHQGNDLMAPQMQPLLAAFDGVIDSIKPNAGSAGNYLTLRGDNGAVARYMHINNDTPGTNDGNGGLLYAFPPGIETGVRVRAGQLIGWCGNSGNAENSKGGHHLHFELWVNGAAVDPAPSLHAATFLAEPSVLAPIYYFDAQNALCQRANTPPAVMSARERSLRASLASRGAAPRPAVKTAVKKKTAVKHRTLKKHRAKKATAKKSTKRSSRSRHRR